MSDIFRVRLATSDDADIIAWHRARMFQDMGEVPDNLFDEFRVRARDPLREALTRGDYIGWLASPENESNIIGGAGLLLQRTLPHPLSRSTDEVRIAVGRHGIILNVFTEPEWRRQGVAASLLGELIDWVRQERLDRLVLHASEEGRALYERLGFVASNEMRFAGK